jgi:hypothetical protein
VQGAGLPAAVSTFPERDQGLSVVPGSVPESALMPLYSAQVGQRLGLCGTVTGPRCRLPCVAVNGASC